MTPAGRKSEGKVRYTLTLDPTLEAAALSMGVTNFSRFMNEAGWREVRRLSKRHPVDTDPKREAGK